MTKKEWDRSIVVEFTIRGKCILDLDENESGVKYISDARVRELLDAELGDEIGQLDVKADVQSVSVTDYYYELCDVDDAGGPE